MKTTKFLKPMLLLFIGVFLVASCSSDDDKETSNPNQGGNGEIPELVFLENPIVLPQALQEENDIHAIELVGRVNSLKSFSNFRFLTIVPPGATKSHTPITPGTSARPITLSTNYTVYTYSYGEGTIAYQFSEQGGMDVIEIFYDDETTTGFVKLMKITQSQDGKQGTLEFYGEDGTNVEQTWTWQINADDSVHINFVAEDFEMDMMYYTDMSGTLKVKEAGVLVAEFQWNADGSGTWTDYENGESGSW